MLKENLNAICTPIEVFNPKHASTILKNLTGEQVLITSPYYTIPADPDNYQSEQEQIVFVLRPFERNSTNDEILELLEISKQSAMDIISHIKNVVNQQGIHLITSAITLEPEFDVFPGWLGYSLAISYR